MVAPGNFPGECLLFQASSWTSLFLFLSLETGPVGSLQGPPASAWQEEDGSCQKVLRF